jgi:hypothetical protein
VIVAPTREADVSDCNVLARHRRHANGATQRVLKVHDGAAVVRAVTQRQA